MNTDLISKIIYKQTKGQPGETFVVFDGEMESLGVMSKNDVIALGKKCGIKPQAIYEY